MDNCGLGKFFKRYIKGTEEKTYVADKILLLCSLTNVVTKELSVKSQKVYVTSKCLKHLYDKKPAEEFECILKYLFDLVKFPDHIYQNKPSKSGSYCLVKDFKGIKYFCSLDNCECSLDEGCDHTNFVVTVFRIRDEAYLKPYKLVWSWKGGFPSS